LLSQEASQELPQSEQQSSQTGQEQAQHSAAVVFFSDDELFANAMALVVNRRAATPKMIFFILD
jgi:hypothetical protein